MMGNKSSVVMDDVENNDRRGHSVYAEHCWRVDCAAYLNNWSSLERSPIQPLVENTSAAAVTSFHYRQRRKKARCISCHQKNMKLLQLLLQIVHLIIGLSKLIKRRTRHLTCNSFRMNPDLVDEAG